MFETYFPMKIWKFVCSRTKIFISKIAAHLNTWFFFLIFFFFFLIAGEFSIPVGVYGQMITGGRKSVSDMDIPIIQWEIMYDGWQLLKCEVQELLYQISRGAGKVSHQVSRPIAYSQMSRYLSKYWIFWWSARSLVRFPLEVEVNTTVWHLIAQSFSLSPFHCLDMTQIMLKGM